jgi:hypothetical protein
MSLGSALVLEVFANGNFIEGKRHGAQYIKLSLKEGSQASLALLLYYKNVVKF